MTTPADSTRGESIIGPIVHPTNRDYQVGGSIHDDATASALGFRGGTIAGSAHLDTLVPLALDAYGPVWLERGTVSMYFRHATTDGEPTRARLTPTADAAQFNALVETPDGIVVGEGTAGLDDRDRTALQTKEIRADESAKRILARINAGDTFGPLTCRVDGAHYRERCERGMLTEVHEWYLTPSPWGACVVAPSAAINLFSDAAGAALLPHIEQAVGMWGALEVANVHGPLLVDTDYELRGTVVAIGDSPKTEILWYDITATRDDVAIATSRILTRFVKGSSPLWS